MTDSITTLVIVDDHSLVRRGFRRLIEDEPDMRVIGEAGDGPGAIEAAQRLRPDVVVIDFVLPGMDGPQTTKQILAVVPETKVLMLSMHAAPTYIRAALEAGAAGYLVKSVVDLDLVKAIREIAAGRPVLDSYMASPPVASPNASPLTARELEVLQHIVYGKSNRQIATDLGVSVNTIAVHRARIMKALALNNTAKLVAYAIRNGLATL